MMPLAWLREYTAPNGTTKGKAFCTTAGASVDFNSEDLRRLVVNATFFLAGLKVLIFLRRRVFGATAEFADHSD
jgi:hypothetical protein